jgi:magnesium chelatase subunit D
MMGDAWQLPDSDAATAALLFACDPRSFGGIVVQGMPSLGRDRWLASLQSLFPREAPWRKVPVGVSEDRLLGGLDFAATLAAGKPVVATGILEATNGGALLLPMAERASASTAAIVSNVLDLGELRMERDGLTRTADCSVGVIALDESMDDEPGLADCLADRLAFRIQLADVPADYEALQLWDPALIAAASKGMESVHIDANYLERICMAAAAFGVGSARAELFVMRAARAAAALEGRESVSEEDVALAARLVLAHRATQLPAVDEQADDSAPPPDDVAEPGTDADRSGVPDEIMVDAVRAAVPAGLLELLQRGGGRRQRSATGGRAGLRTLARKRGRPVGVAQADTISGARLNVLATLKTAAPWQVLRKRQDSNRNALVQIRRDDLRVTRFEDSMESTTVFVVDASGSQAARRLAEVKGAIEILLNDCYVRRDQVALIAFRGKGADLLLPPTRALARARRSLAALPGGGATPLASGLDSARELADSIAHHGRVPAIVLMTDGRANVTRDQQQDIVRAEADALDSAREMLLAGYRSLLVDTARRPRPRARVIADAMGARYVPLPQADASTISAAVQANAA